MVSIIIPVYNVEKYLERCLESVLCQSYKEIEIVLVNDGSTDGSGEICDLYTKRAEHVHVIHKENGGLSSARNVGLQNVKGEYVFFLDSDDYLHPQTIELLYHSLIKTNAEIAACHLRKVQEEEKVFFNSLDDVEILCYSGTEAMNHVDNVYVIACNKLIKKDLLKKNSFREGSFHEDEFWIHRILYDCSKIVLINAELYYYVQHRGSITSNVMKKNIIDKTEALLDRIDFSFSRNWDAVYESCIKRFFEYIYEIIFYDKNVLLIEKILWYEIKKYIYVFKIARKEKICIERKYKYIWLIYFLFRIKKRFEVFIKCAK